MTAPSIKAFGFFILLTGHILGFPQADVYKRAAPATVLIKTDKGGLTSSLR